MSADAMNVKIAELRQQAEALAAEEERLRREYEEQFLATFGAAVAERRKRSKMTQQDLADRVGLTRSSVANIEAGRQCPPLTVAALIASALGTPLSHLIGDAS